MENIPVENIPETGPRPESPEAPKEKTLQIKIEFKKAVIAGIVIGAIIVAGLAVYFLRGLVMAAKVNGSYISRFAVISELERASGKSALDALITQKLIDEEALKNNIVISAEELAAEITNIGNRLKTQGQDLTQALADAGMTMADLEKNVATQKKLEKLVADKITVTGEEVAQYIKDYKVPVTKGKEVEVNAQIEEQLRQQKMSEASSALIDSLRSAASIKYFGKYAK